MTTRGLRGIWPALLTPLTEGLESTSIAWRGMRAS
jgi:hypothetical protein